MDERGKLESWRTKACSNSLFLFAWMWLLLLESMVAGRPLRSSHHASLPGEELKLLPHEAFQRNLEIQYSIWLDLILQSVGDLVEWGTKHQVEGSFMSEKVKLCQMQQYRKNGWQVCELSREETAQGLKTPPFILSHNYAIVWTVANLRITANSPVQVFSGCMDMIFFIGISALNGAG